MGEQVAEKGAKMTIGPQTDLYALGVIFYLMITHENPTWYIKYSGYNAWSKRNDKQNTLLKLFDSTLLRLLDERSPSSRGTIDDLLMDIVEIINTLW